MSTRMTGPPWWPPGAKYQAETQMNSIDPTCLVPGGEAPASTLVLQQRPDINLPDSIERAIYQCPAGSYIETCGQPAPAFIECSRDGVCMFSSSGAIVATNPAFARMHGYSVEEILTSNIRTLDTAEGEGLFGALRQPGQGAESMTFEAEHMRKDGQRISLEVSAKIIQAGDDFLLIGVHRDITRRKQAERSLLDWNRTLERRVAERTEELLRSKTRFRHLSEAAFEGIAITEGEILLDGNTQLGVMFGYEITEMISRPMAEFIAPESQAWIPEPVQWDSEGTYEFVGLRRDGSTFPAEAHVRMMRWQGQAIQCTALRDLSAVALMASRLQAQQAGLEHTLRLALVSEVSTGIIHQIGQPLCAMGANLAAAVARMRASGNHDSDSIEILLDIEANMHRIRDSVLHLRALAHPERPKRRPNDINALLDGILLLLQREAQSRQILLVVGPGHDIPPVLADGGQLSQVILNLTRNAFDACADCPLERRFVVITTRTLTGEDVELSVRDAGSGIAPEDMEQLFSPFFTTKPDGLGIGLRLSRTIIEAHGGRIECCNNADGIGATFRLVLPEGSE